MVHVIWSTFVSRLAPLIYDTELYIYARVPVPESTEQMVLLVVCVVEGERMLI